MTIYRRELSCNHGYHIDDDDDDDDQDDNGDEYHHHHSKNSKTSQHSSPKSAVASAATWDDESTELLLEGAGNYCSGQPLFLALGALWFNIFITASEPITTTSREGQEQEELVYKNNQGTRQHRDKRRLLQPKLPIISNATSSIVTGQQQQQQQSLQNDHHDKNSLLVTLPPDCQVHVLSFLHPRDVVHFACTNQSCYELVEKGDTSMALWKDLWYRDYSWIVTEWEVGKLALQRSFQTLQRQRKQQQLRGSTTAPSDNDSEVSKIVLNSIQFNKDFYFRFGQSYLNYILAGQNKSDRCLVGLYGHIYDITSFLDKHPGSPDTLLVHSGRDTTKYFEDMGHSTGARKLSRNMCVVVDTYCISASHVYANMHSDKSGLYPTNNTTGTTDTTTKPRNVITTGLTVPLERSSNPRIRPHTLHSVRNQYQRMEQRQYTQMETQLSNDPNSHVLGPINVYYDPFVQEWQSWYTNTSLETVFVL